MTAIKLAIGVPAYGGHVTAYHAPMWASLGRALARRHERFHEVMFAYVDINGVQRARNRLLAEAMMAGADWLFMIDADTWVERSAQRPHLGSSNDPAAPGEVILRMIDEAACEEIAVVSAPVRMRLADERWLYAAFRGNDGNLRPIARGEISRSLQRVEHVGAACLAVDLHAVAHVGASFVFTDVLSEDREFCRQMRDAGQQIALDGRVRTGHLSRAAPLYSE